MLHRLRLSIEIKAASIKAKSNSNTCKKGSWMMQIRKSLDATYLQNENCSGLTCDLPKLFWNTLNSTSLKQ